MHGAGDLRVRFAINPGDPSTFSNLSPGMVLPIHVVGVEAYRCTTFTDCLGVVGCLVQLDKPEPWWRRWWRRFLTLRLK